MYPRKTIVLYLIVLSVFACRPKNESPSPLAQNQTEHNPPPTNPNKPTTPSQVEKLDIIEGGAANAIQKSGDNYFVLVSDTAQLIRVSKDLSKTDVAASFPKDSSPYEMSMGSSVYVSLINTNQVVELTTSGFQPVKGLNSSEMKVVFPQALAQIGDRLISTFNNLHKANGDFVYGAGKIAVTQLKSAKTSWIDSPTANPWQVESIDSTHAAIASGRVSQPKEGKVSILNFTSAAQWEHVYETPGYPGKMAYSSEKKMLFVCDGTMSSQFYQINLLSNSPTSAVSARAFNGEKGRSCLDVVIDKTKMYALSFDYQGKGSLHFWKAFDSQAESCSLPLSISTPTDMELGDGAILILTNENKKSPIYSVRLDNEGSPCSSR